MWRGPLGREKTELDEFKDAASMDAAQLSVSFPPQMCINEAPNARITYGTSNNSAIVDILF
jgi:hypothetical protein